MESNTLRERLSGKNLHGQRQNEDLRCIQLLRPLETDAQDAPSN